ncbi:hypothetical protein RUM43_014665 [Polyplax serrata]|uniref:Immunoglobulin I-set domain-containing protein n=1 Tax=Polyplax serrata TaxID=468196 RepID=A0AAN8PID0_POLSC
MVISSDKYEVQMISKSLFEVRMVLLIRNFQRLDVGSYRCIAKNSLGEVDSSIRLYEIPGPTRAFPPPYDEEDYSEQYGSAEDDDDREEEMSNALPGRNSWSFSSETPGGPIRGTFYSSFENQAQVPPVRGGHRNTPGGASRKEHPVSLLCLLLGLALLSH